MSDSLEEKIEEIVELYDRAQEEHRSNHKEQNYWQGRKDGLRLALAILQPDQNLWKLLNKSSWGFQDETWLRVKKFMEDARYNISAILYDLQMGKKVHPMTRINLIQWIDQYDQMAKEEITLPVTDACDSFPNFQWKR